MAAVAATAAPSQSPLVANQAASASILYCQVGGVGLQALDDPERFFAIAVIEVRSPKTIDNPTVTSFDLIDARSVARSRLRRVTDVLEFTRPRIESEGIAAHFGNSTGNRPWTVHSPPASPACRFVSRSIAHRSGRTSWTFVAG